MAYRYPALITPGLDGQDRVVCTANSKRRTVAHVYGRTPQERDALARIFAQAPAMAEALRDCIPALKWLVGETQGNPDRVNQLNKVQAILASLEG